MFTYEEFMEMVCEELLMRLPKGYEIELKKEDEDLLYFYGPQRAFSKPCIKAELLYNFYLVSGDFASAVEQCVDLVLTNPACLTEKLQISASVLKEYVTICLVNYEYNKHMLRNIPHRIWHDMAIYYVLVFPGMDGCFENVVVTEQIQRELGVSENDMYAWGISNLLLLFQFDVVKLSEFLGLPAEYAESMFALYMLKSNQIHFGAACLLNDELLERIATVLDDSFYILPSSTDELLLIPERWVCEGMEDYVHMVVTEINEMIVVGWRKLSDNLFFYDRNKCEVRVVDEA